MIASRTRRSAGILLFRRTGSKGVGTGGIELLLAYPGGPIWARKPDEGSWSIPKGLIDPDEAEWDAARREYLEEIGSPVPDSPPVDLGEVTLKSGKIVIGFGVEGDLDVTTVVSNTFEMAWPPRSGRMQSFPEIDRAAWFDPETAKKKLNPAQAAFVDRLLEALRDAG